MLEEGRTLSAVIARIPKACYRNPTWKGLAYVARDAALYLAVVAALVMTDSLLLLVPLWILAALVISALFILGHDAAHGALFSNRRLNYFVGQACMLPTLHLYEMWCYGHNRIHHGHTTREVMDYVWHPITPDDWAQMSTGERLLHRFKWSWLGGGIYYLWDIWWKRMIRFTPPDRIKAEVQRDRWVVGSFLALTSVLLVGGGIAQGGTLGAGIWMWTKVFGMPFLLWNYSIGIAVYIHHIAQDIPWHERRTWTKFAGQVEGTTVLHIPRWLNFFYHNIFLHVPHHVDMRIPFYGLPAATEALRKHYGSQLRERVYGLRDYLATTRTCKLFDFSRGVWCDYQGTPWLPLDLSPSSSTDTSDPTQETPRKTTPPPYNTPPLDAPSF